MHKTFNFTKGNVELVRNGEDSLGIGFQAEYENLWKKFSICD